MEIKNKTDENDLNKFFNVSFLKIQKFMTLKSLFGHR